MRWMRSKKPRVLEIPAEHVEVILAMWEAYNRQPVGQDKVSRYKLFQLIGDILPETLEGTWHIDSPTALRVTLTEVPK